MGSAAAAVAPQPAIRDDAQFFQPQVREQAAEFIREIHQRTGKEVVIETFPVIPPNLQAKFNSMDKSWFYHDWGAGRGRELGLNGIYILVVRQPGHLEITLGRTHWPARRRSPTATASNCGT